MSMGFVAEGGHGFDQLSSWYVDEYGQKTLRVNEDGWDKLQRLLASYDSMAKSDDADLRARGREGRYATERAINIITEGLCNR